MDFYLNSAEPYLAENRIIYIYNEIVLKVLLHLGGEIVGYLSFYYLTG